MIQQIKETCLYIQDLRRTKEFYNEKMGFEIIGEVAGRHIFFRVGTSVLLCFLSESTRKESTLPPHFATGSIHLAFEVQPKDYEMWKEKIRNLDIKIIQEYTWENGLKSFYFHDPDNHLLEIVPKGIWE